MINEQSVHSPGESIIALVSQAEREVLLAAPFIKLSALKRILHSIPQHVKTTCVTRWEATEILAGVSDIEIWDLIRSRPLSMLHLRMSLHAKFYRADQQCLIGSANLTDAALGWGQHTNLELLVPIKADDSDIEWFEQELLCNSIIVDQSVYDATLAAVNKMHEAGIRFPVPAVQGTIVQAPINIEDWLPSCRAPDRLFDAYKGRDDRMLSSAFEDAQRDLAVLNPPAGLDRSAFNAYIASLLDQHPLIRQIDDFVSVPRTSEEISSRLASLLGALKHSTSFAEIWYVLKLWLLTFFPDRYRVKPPEGVEVFVRGRRLA